MWEELYRLHYQELLAKGMAGCHHRELAEDVVQETFVKALQNADIFEDLSASQRRAWLFRTMKNLLCDRYRRAALEQQYTQEQTETAWIQEPGFQSVENALLLASLSAEEQMLLQLRFEEGYTAAELAEMLGIPAGTIRSKLSRSRKILKKALEEI
ncbi:MAG TPA: RNA polymerase sigma factor [Candidatus Faecousia intestinigallinarum]|nr:RNA polymerase sigma factor [Candidatus Faecousia intestinigallinarum]